MDSSFNSNKPDHFHALYELAMDLHWSWSHATDKIWQQLDPVLWERTHNPLVVLQTVARNRIELILQQPIVRDIIQELIEAKRQRPLSPAWFQKAYPNSSLKSLAFFSMEYMLSEALPIYSGGLGNVSGDLLKTASDLGVPVIGVGLLYQQGYARQVIYGDGSQQYIAPYNDPGQLPVMPLRNEHGEWLRIEIKVPGSSLWLRTWKVQVGRVSLFLLDSNDAANFPNHRGITSELYCSDPDLRLLQEIILGIGGLRLLKQLGIDPDVLHLNEGHSAFAVLERARNFMIENEQSFTVALNVTRAGTIFTTHTAIGAGFDRFPPMLIQKYLGHYIDEDLKLSLQQFLALGRVNASDELERFNTAYLAIRGSGYINGVSRLHAEVSKQLFANLFQGWPIDEVPVSYVTNGVHMPSWDSPDADKLWTEACGKERWQGSLQTIEKSINKVSDERLWALRKIRSEEFIQDIRQHYTQQLETIACSEQEIREVDKLFDPSFLLLGFARRFVPYKRPDLLLHDKERLKKILSNAEMPVQLVVAGKAHPQDTESQKIISEWVQFINDYNVKANVVFLSDYDMLLTEQMVQGVDVWINTPRRPWEACGTSGMKVLVNGGLNLSELDGWWDEAYSPEVGWTFGDRQEITDDALHDREDAERLYTILENEIIPLFYKRNEQGLAIEWVRRMRSSMAQLTFQYSSIRSLQEYTEKYYHPAASLYQKRLTNRGEEGNKIGEWQTFINDHWKGINCGNPDIQKKDGCYEFSVPVFLNGLNASEVSVELYANGINNSAPLKQRMIINPKHENGAVIFCATVPADRPSHHYTPRILPVNPLASIPLECSNILWQR